jgi:hypothetical protein
MPINAVKILVQISKHALRMINTMSYIILLVLFLRNHIISYFFEFLLVLLACFGCVSK